MTLRVCSPLIAPGTAAATLLLLAPCLAAQRPVAEVDYPQARRGDVVDTVAGHPVPDPYAWLEEQDAPEVRRWIDAQNAMSDRVLSSLPALDRIRPGVLETVRAGSVGRPAWRDGKLYYMKRPPGAERSAYYVREGLDGEERVLLDPASVSSDPTVTVDVRATYGDGRYLVYGVRRGGQDETSIHIRDLETGRELPDSLPWGYYRSLSMNADGTGFYYSWDQDQQPGKAAFHELGTPVATDTVVFPAERREDWVNVSEVGDGRWLLATVAHGWRSTDVYVKERRGAGDWRAVQVGRDALASARWMDGRVWLLTELGAPKKRLVAVDPAAPDPDDWEVVLPETDETLDGWSTSGPWLFARYITQDVATRLVMYERDGTVLTRIRDIELPGRDGNAGLPWGGPDGKVFFTYESFTDPSVTFLYDPVTTEREVFQAEEKPVDTDDWVVELEWYTSKDGVQVPLHVVHRAGVSLDGETPTLLGGYGGFDVARLPGWSDMTARFVDAGGVYALAHLRGGSEFGRRWHMQGMLDFKQNVFNDMIGAAEHLVARGYTRPARLAIQGGSNGGLLMGACVTQRPELFSAVLAGVPELDLVGFPNYLKINPPALEEYGDATIPAEFQWIIRWSPLQNLRQGVGYPAMLLMTGDMDSRVDPTQARKFTAKAQWATASEPDTEPVLLSYGPRVGHSGGRTPSESAELEARQLAFLDWQLGGPWTTEGR